LYRSAAEALAVRRGELRLVECRHCGFVHNTAFRDDLMDYSPDYEVSQAHSPVFRDFARRTARDLVDRHALNEPVVVEIGSGGGDFLRLVVKTVGGRGIGFDPLFGPSDDGAVEIRRETFGSATRVDGDLLVCRHTLEHLIDPVGLALCGAAVMGPGTPVYLEVPDLGRIVDQGAFWDLYHEHVGYFDPHSLAGAAGRAGVAVGDTELVFSDQYVVAHGTVDGRRREVESTRCRRDWGAMAASLDTWSQWARQVASSGRLLVWGATSRSACLLASVPELEIVALTDVNPAKWGMYLPGVAVPISSPDEVVSLRPDLALALNPIYGSEIGASLSDMGLDIPLWVLGSTPTVV
ncbi:MAG: class I SAM-dependent methyltransferase, partial [Acidimicrobiales bacterium]